MRGTKAKAIRRFVKERFPFLSETPLYMRGPHAEDQVILASQCQRKLVKETKRSYKISKRTNNEKWRKYNEQRTG
jgi:hypothetical protein